MTNRYVPLPGVAGAFGTTPNLASHNVVGDLDVRVKVSMNSWTPAATQVLMSKSNVSGTQTAWRFQVGTLGGIQFFLKTSTNVDISWFFTPAQIYPDGGTRWLRMVVDVDDGAGHNVGTLYSSEDGVNWSQEGTVASPNNFFSIKSVTAPLAIGAIDNGANGNFAGKIYVAEVRAGIDGTVVASFNANDGAIGASAITSSATGEVWTFTGNGAVVIGVPTFSDVVPLNYYAVEEALVAFLTAAVPVANVFSVTRLLHIPSLFERVQPSPTPEQLLADPTLKHGAIFLFFSGLDSVKSQARGDDCETSEQEWHLFIFTRYHQSDFSKNIARKINGMLTAQVIRALKNLDWLKYYYGLQGMPSNSGASSNLRRVTADKLLVAETRAIEDPTLAETLLAYQANLSSNWKGVTS